MFNSPLVQNYINMFRSFATFTGRASRGEYWWAFLMNFIIVFAMQFIMTVIKVTASLLGGSVAAAMLAMLFSTIQSIYSLVIMVPMLALQVRRLHDVNRSGWWLLFSGTGIGAIFLLIWYCQKGTEDTNLFGSDPHPIRQY